MHKEKLKDIAEITMGTSPSGDTYNEDENGLPLLNGPTEFGQMSPNCTLFTTDSKRECKRGDLIFCVRGSTTGRMNWADQVYSLGRGVCSIRGNSKSETKYIKYALDYSLRSLLKLAGGGTFPNLTKTTIHNFEIPYPDSRFKIASILSAFDDLIKNNSRRIEILEEMARRIYREWFVHFRYPGHEDDVLVDSDTELGEIPEGWEVIKLENIIELNYGKGLRKKDRVEGKYPVYGSSGVIDWHNDYQVKGPGVIVGRKGNVGSMFWEYENFNPIDTTFYVETSLPLTYAFYNLQNQNFINSDAAVPGLSKRQASTLPVLVPDKKILESFDTKILQLFELKRVLSEKNKKLKETRDLLLPKLISGKIDVEEVKV